MFWQNDPTFFFFHNYFPAAEDLLDILQAPYNDATSHNILFFMPSMEDQVSSKLVPLNNMAKYNLNGSELNSIKEDIGVALEYLHEHNLDCLDSLNLDHILIKKVGEKEKLTRYVLL